MMNLSYKSLRVKRESLKGSQLDAFCHRPYCTVDLNSNFAILKNWYGFQLEKNNYLNHHLCEEKVTDDCFFKSIFVRNRSLSKARWFYAKKCKIGKGNLYATKNWVCRNEIYCAEDNHSYMSNMCANSEFSDSNYS